MSVVARDTAELLDDCAAVHGYVERVCFKTGPPSLVGAELEWLVGFEADPAEMVPIELLGRLLGSAAPPPHGSTLTYEPGGQLELSSRPAADPSTCWRSLAAEVDHVRGVLAPHGLVLLPTGIDAHRPPRRQLCHPRYDAMERYFTAIGARHGPVSMNSTAAIQVNLDIGADPVDAARRWRLLHTIGPTMIACFANSPVHAERATGWKSTRQHVWQDLDAQRTRPPESGDPATTWANYALDADLMLVRRVDEGDWSVAPGTTFRDWVEGRLGPAPTSDDLDYHLTTLFPPVRPRGWYEVRYLDAQALEWWPVPLAVLSALVDDPDAGEAATVCCAGVGQEWRAAARGGLASPELAAAAKGCFAAALTALSAHGADPELVDLVAGFADTYVEHGRCPADDTLAEEL